MIIFGFQLDDVGEDYKPPRNRGDSDANSGRRQQSGPNQFVVKGGPWEQSMPDTNDTEQFPSMGSSAVNSVGDADTVANAADKNGREEVDASNHSSQESKWSSRV